MRVYLISAVSFFSTLGLGCPNETLEIYNGEEAHGVCYQDNGKMIYWTHVSKACLAADGVTITFEKDDAGQERLIGVCNGTFEIRY